MSNVNTELLLDYASGMRTALTAINKNLNNLDSDSRNQYDDYNTIMGYNGTEIERKKKFFGSGYTCYSVSIYASPPNIDYYTNVKTNYDKWVTEIELLSKAISYMEENADYIDELYNEIIKILDNSTYDSGIKESYKKEVLGDDGKPIIPRPDLSEPFTSILLTPKKENNLQNDPTEKPGDIKDTPIIPTKDLEDIEYEPSSPNYENDRRNYENNNYENNNDGVKKVGKIAPIVNVSSEAISSIRDNNAELEKKYDSDIDNLNSDSNNDNNKVDKLAASVKDVYKVNKETNDNASNQPIDNSQVIVEQQIGAAKPIVGVAQQVTNAGGSIPTKAGTNSTLSYNPVTNDDDSTMVSYNDSKPYVDGQNNNSSVISVSDNKGLNNIIPGVAAIVAGTGVGLAVKGKLDEDKDEEYEIEG